MIREIVNKLMMCETLNLIFLSMFCLSLVVGTSYFWKTTFKFCLLDICQLHYSRHF